MPCEKLALRPRLKPSEVVRDVPADVDSPVLSEVERVVEVEKDSACETVSDTEFVEEEKDPVDRLSVTPEEVLSPCEVVSPVERLTA